MAHGQQFSICVRSRQAVLGEWQQDCERFVRREVSPVTVQKHRSLATLADCLSLAVRSEGFLHAERQRQVFVNVAQEKR